MAGMPETGRCRKGMAAEFTQVFSRHGKKRGGGGASGGQESASRAGDFGLSSAGIDRCVRRVPGWSDRASSRERELQKHGHMDAEEGKAPADLLPGRAPWLSSGEEGEKAPAGGRTGEVRFPPDREGGHEHAEKRGAEEAAATPDCGLLCGDGECGGGGVPG